MAYSGRFTPSNPQKYVGDYKNIIYRSSWECRVMNWLDKNPDIISWASEELTVPYKSPIDGKWHRYFPDFLVKMRTRDGQLKTLMLEVKPKKETTLEGAKNIRDQAAAVLNMAKWEAARAWCKQRGIMFRIVNENDIFQNCHLY